jgi:gliding motility-associated-like protein
MALNEFAVYNRWGEKIYSTSDITAGWNGTYKNKAQEIGVYVWYIKATTFDGDIVFKKGNVTLIR